MLSDREGRTFLTRLIERDLREETKPRSAILLALGSETLSSQPVHHMHRTRTVAAMHAAVAALLPSPAPDWQRCGRVPGAQPHPCEGRRQPSILLTGQIRPGAGAGTGHDRHGRSHPSDRRAAR